MAGIFSRPFSFGAFVIARSEATKQSIDATEAWIASRSLSSGAHSRDPLVRNDGARFPFSSLNKFFIVFVDGMFTTFIRRAFTKHFGTQRPNVCSALPVTYTQRGLTPRQPKFDTNETGRILRMY
jgi:hypothetical protein